MLVRVVNPNTSAAMTAAIGRSAAAVAAVGTTVEAVNPSMGPASIESHYDEALAVPGLLEEIARGDRDGADAYVVACFGDPGLDAAREVARGPVVGIAEAGMLTASMLGRGFSVVTTLERTTGRALELTGRYGVTDRCRSVRACEIPVLELEEPGSDAERRITEECARAVTDDRADVVVLGCAGMADLARRISRSVGVPVIDGVAAATKAAESLVVLGLTTSRRCEFAPPRSKRYTGLLEAFTVT